MSKDREKILQMVADGTITLEEATRLLECLDVVADIEPQEQEKSLDAGKENAVNFILQDTPEEEKKPVMQGKSQAGAQSQPGIPETPQAPGMLLPLESNQNQYSSATSWIRGLKISWINGPVEIRSYDGDVVNITEYSKVELREDDKMDITEENGVIRVKWDRRGGIFSLTSLTRLLGRPFLKKHLLVEIPRALQGKLETLECSGISSEMNCAGIAAEQLELSSTSGKVNLLNITARRIKASSISGAVRVDKLTAGEMILTSTSGSVLSQDFSVNQGDWNSVSGKVTLMGDAKSVKVSTVSGGVEGRLEDCPENMEIDTVSGGIKMFLPDNEGFHVSYSSVSSHLDTQFPVTGNLGKKSGDAVYGNGKAKIRMGTVSGGLRLYHYGSNS